MTDYLTIPGDGAKADAEDTPFVASPMYLRPGRRAGMTVYADGTVEHSEGTPHARPAPASSGASSGPIRPTFQTEGGRPVLSRDVTGETLVVNPQTGEVESTVAAMLASGLMVEGPNGYELTYQRSDGRAPRGGPEQQQAPEADQQGDQADANGFVEPMMPEHEAAYTAAAEKVGDTLFSAVEVAMADATLEEIPSTLVASVASRLGTDEAGALQAIGEAAAPMLAQASARVDTMVGEGNSGEVFEWARSSPEGQKLLSAAARGQLDRRDLSGYTALTHEWLRDLAQRDPARVAAGITSGGGKAKVVSGKVLVDLEDGQGWSEFTSALRGGAAQIGQPRRRR